MHPYLLARKVTIGIVGGIILIAGIISIVIPTPATILLPLGLMILATEFVMVQDILRASRRRINSLYCEERRKTSPVCRGIDSVFDNMERRIAQKNEKTKEH